MQAWEDLVSRIKNPVDEITIHVVGKYVGYEDSYKSLNEALYHGGFPHRAEGEHQVDRGRGARGAGRRGAARRRRRHSRAGRVRRSRHARHDEGGAGRARAADSLLRHLLRLPVGDGRVRAQRRRPGRCRLDRVQPRHAGEGDLQAARSARRRRSRRHDAPRQLRLRAGAGLARAARLRRDARFTSVIAIATSSTACTSGRSPSTACGSRAARRTASSSRSPSCPAIPGTSRCSSIPSSSRSRRGRIRSSPRSSTRRTSTRRHAARTRRRADARSIASRSVTGTRPQAARLPVRPV